MADERTMLDEFFGAYFHQDWLEDHATTAEVVRSYVQEMSGLEDLVLLSAAIRRFAASFSADAELERALYDQLGCYYLPSADGLTAHSWMESVAKQLESSVR